MTPGADTPAGLRAFFAHLLEFESGVSPARHDWYCRHYDEPVMRYVEVESPGRLVRDPLSGDPVPCAVTVRGYFEALGIADGFDARDAGCLRRMQYRSTNAWGFIGYQFGEAILIANGYYEPEHVDTVLEDGSRGMLGSWYLGSVPPLAWTHGVRSCLAVDPDSGARVVATDVNRWRGRFTGLDGVASLADLFEPERQDAVVRRTLRSNLGRVRAAVLARGVDWDDALSRRFEFQGDTFVCTGSGLLAATHLRGAEATAALLLDGAPSVDELGTSILDYVRRFAGYDVSGL